MSEIQAQEEYWTRKVNEALAVLDIHFVKPMNDLKEALQQLFTVQNMKRNQLEARVKILENKQEEKSSQ